MPGTRPEPAEWISPRNAGGSIDPPVNPSPIVDGGGSTGRGLASYGKIAAVIALVAIALGGVAEGWRRWAAEASPGMTYTNKKPATAPKDGSENAEREQNAVSKRIADELRQREIVAGQRVATEMDPVRLDEIATAFPALADVVNQRRGLLAAADEAQRQKAAEKSAEAEIAVATDRARLTEIATNWPRLKPAAEVRSAALEVENAKASQDRMTRVAQDGLRRAGCFAVPTTGTWGPATKKAAEDFNRHAPVKIAIDGAAAASETILSAVKSRVCPVVCAPPKIAKDGECKAMTCGPGTVQANGACEPAYLALIGKHETQAGAEALFSSLQSAHASLLQGRPADIKDVGRWFSVRVGPAATKDAVLDLCGKLKTGGLPGCVQDRR